MVLLLSTVQAQENNLTQSQIMDTLPYHAPDGFSHGLHGPISQEEGC